MEKSSFSSYAEITKDNDEDNYKKLMRLSGNNFERAIELYFSQANTNNSLNETYKRRCPSDAQDTEKLYLGHFISEAVSLRQLTRVPRYTTFHHKFIKPSKLKKKNEHTDKSIRLSLEPEGFSVAKLNYAISEHLYPLLSSDLISIEITNLETVNVNTLDSFKVVISATVLPGILTDPKIKSADEIANKKLSPEEYCMQREAFKHLILALNLTKTQTALICKEDPPNTQLSEADPAVEISEEEKSQYLCHFEQPSIPETSPVDSFKTALFPYQAQALTWMLERETSNRASSSTSQLHHLWEEYTLLSSKKLYINSCTSQISVIFPEAGSLCKGGILADEMGLGKTVMMISLIHTNLKPHRYACKQIKRSNEGGTLIVVPLSLMSQWKGEIQLHGSGLTVVEYYAEKTRTVSELTKTDVVLTTYGIVSSESVNKGPLTQISWFRVIIDEAHQIRNRNTAQAKAMFKIQADHKWALTGTPIQNTIDDLYSLIKFLEIEPWSEYIWWNKVITQKFLKKNPECYTLLQRLLRPIMLRRTKASRLENGVPIISLPPLIVETVRVSLSESDQQDYTRLFNYSRAKYSLLLSEGKIRTHVTCIFELLLRLRQFCDHPHLVASRGDVLSPEALASFMQKYTSEGNSAYIDSLQTQLKGGVDLDCPVCLETCEDPVITKCAHVLCRACAMVQVNKNHNCPLCKTQLSHSDLKTVPRNTKFSFDVKANWRSSAKIDRLMQLLGENEEPTVVFSQWTSMLDLLEIAMEMQGVSYARLDGSLTKGQRDASLMEFRQGKKVLLVSLRSGGQGLNLICASRVVLMDPWWNPAAERQAIERVHRIGQVRSVRAYKFVCNGTVEEKILEMQTRKEAMVEGAFCEGVCSLNLETLKSIFQDMRC